MDNKHNSDISADELLAQLKANMADGNTDEKSVTGKKYKFRRSGKITASVSEEDIRAHMPDNSDYSFESPIPKSDIEDLDIDELMKKYLPEDSGILRFAARFIPVRSDPSNALLKYIFAWDTTALNVGYRYPLTRLAAAVQRAVLAGEIFDETYGAIAK